ncbi:MAG: hypothetical protein K9N10_00045 [Deltaproteobacteria bacterium]|nr:hypothetical protein [Deltaproteobacteria bacterium]
MDFDEHVDFDDFAAEITITGVVMATEWDDDDEITGLEISTDDDGYYVEKNAIWDELVDLWDTQVEVTGMVIEERDGTRRILVTSYEPLEDVNFDEDEGDYDDIYEELSFENEEEEVRYQ